MNILFCPVDEGGDDCQLFLIGLWFYNVYFTELCVVIFCMSIYQIDNSASTCVFGGGQQRFQSACTALITGA